MRRTLFNLVLAVSAGCLTLSSITGCLHSKSAARPSSQSQDLPALLDSDEDSPMGTRTILQNQNRTARSPGGWSNQANEIEKHLGVQ